MGQSSQ
jgi:hypothetical protein